MSVVASPLLIEIGEDASKRESETLSPYVAAALSVKLLHSTFP